MATRLGGHFQFVKFSDLFLDSLPTVCCKANEPSAEEDDGAGLGNWCGRGVTGCNPNAFAIIIIAYMNCCIKTIARIFCIKIERIKVYGIIIYNITIKRLGNIIPIYWFRSVISIFWITITLITNNHLLITNNLLPITCKLYCSRLAIQCVIIYTVRGKISCSWIL